MKAEALTDSTIQMPKAQIVIELSNGEMVTATGFVIGDGKGGEPTIVLKAGKTQARAAKSPDRCAICGAKNETHEKDHLEFIEDMRSYRVDHLPDGWPAVQTWKIDRLIEIIDRLQLALSGKTQFDVATVTATRCAEIAHNTEPPKSIGRQMGGHHSAGAQHAAKRIRSEFGLCESPLNRVDKNLEQVQSLKLLQ
jgi:hypothetical protein